MYVSRGKGVGGTNFLMDQGVYGRMNSNWDIYYDTKRSDRPCPRYFLPSVSGLSSPLLWAHGRVLRPPDMQNKMPPQSICPATRTFKLTEIMHHVGTIKQPGRDINLPFLSPSLSSLNPPLIFHPFFLGRAEDMGTSPLNQQLARHQAHGCPFNRALTS